MFIALSKLAGFSLWLTTTILVSVLGPIYLALRSCSAAYSAACFHPRKSSSLFIISWISLSACQQLSKSGTVTHRYLGLRTSPRLRSFCALQQAAGLSSWLSSKSLRSLMAIPKTSFASLGTSNQSRDRCPLPIETATLKTVVNCTDSQASSHTAALTIPKPCTSHFNPCFPSHPGS